MQNVQRQCDVVHIDMYLVATTNRLEDNRQNFCIQAQVHQMSSNNKSANTHLFEEHFKHISQ